MEGWRGCREGFRGGGRGRNLQLQDVEAWAGPERSRAAVLALRAGSRGPGRTRGGPGRSRAAAGPQSYVQGTREGQGWTREEQGCCRTSELGPGGSVESVMSSRGWGNKEDVRPVRHKVEGTGLLGTRWKVEAF